MMSDNTWTTSSYCGTNACVEVTTTTTPTGALYHVRDGKNPDGPILEFTADEWNAFTKGVKDGEFDAE